MKIKEKIQQEIQSGNKTYTRAANIVEVVLILIIAVSVIVIFLII